MGQKAVVDKKDVCYEVLTVMINSYGKGDEERIRKITEIYNQEKEKLEKGAKFADYIPILLTRALKESLRNEGLIVD